MHGRYLVTGGAGFIGSHVCEALLSRGDQVVAVDNLDPFYAVELKHRNVEALQRSPAGTFVEGDICEAQLLQRLCADFAPDYVIHLAAKAGVRPSVEAPLDYVEVNVKGTLQLLECARRGALRKLVFASSSSVYGASNRVPFAESESVCTPLSPYAASKIAGEALCHAYHHTYGLPIVCLRFFTAYGPRQRPDLAINKFAHLIAQGKPIPMYGDGSSERDYTFVSDIVGAVLLAAASELQYEVINIGGARPVSLRTLIDLLQELMGRSAPVEQFAAQAGDMPRTYADITRARELLGWAPTVELREGLREFLRWRETCPVIP